MNNTLSQFEILTLQQETKNYWLAIIVAIITFVSVMLIFIDYKNRKNKEKAEKSIEIAKDFALRIVEPASVLYAYFEDYNISKIINKINFMQLEYFDFDELQSLYDATDIEEYKNAMDKNDPKHKIRHIICDTLNTLEYMCMYIVTNVADEKYIYNSLHQQFLKTIALLYFEISMTNIDNKDKYFTNIIHVYNLWKNKYLKAIKKEKKLKRKLLSPTPKI